jgi:hypothetical protein
MSELTAESLLKKSNIYYVAVIIKNLAKNIDMKIMTTHESGGNNITYELPITFTINNMPLIDAQTLIYSEILELYIKKGFTNTKINITSKNTILHISWLNGLTNEEREKRKNFIKTCLI